MAHVMKEQLDCIAVVLAKNDKKLYTKTDVNRAIVTELSERVSWTCSHGYIANLRRGVQLDKAGAVLKSKISQLHTLLCKPPKEKPGPGDIAKRTVVYNCTKPEQDELRAEKDPKKRAEKTLRALRSLEKESDEKRR